MSQSKSKAHHPSGNVVEDDLKPPEMSTRKRVVLIGVAIFCLVIFSVTGPMYMAFSGLAQGEAAAVATAVLPSGEVNFTQDDLFSSRRILSWEERLIGRRHEDSDNGTLTYALLRKLADDLNLVVHPAVLRGQIQSMISQRGFPDYKSLREYYGFNNALSFENQLAEVLRVPLLEGMMSSAQVSSKEDVLKMFQDRYEELKAEYIVWTADDFASASLVLDPTEEELQEFYDSGLSFTQKRDLELEETVTFDALLLTADALETDAVKAWAPQEDPTEEELNSFYDFNKRFLYMRPSPEEIEEPVTEPFLSREELGDDLKRDFLLQRAILTMVVDAGEAEDLQVFADEKGLEWIQQTESVTRSQLEDLPRLGTDQLSQLFRFELNQWLGRAILNDGTAFLARPLTRTDRELPSLEEIKDSVTDYWRESRQPVLAREAAEAFLATFPQPEVEGDAITVDHDGFATAVGSEEMEIQSMDWISKTRRPAMDPIWPADDKISPWLRGQIGRQLEDYEDDQLIGPLEYNLPTDKYIVVVRLYGTREPDTGKIWPNELDSIRASAGYFAASQFVADQLSFEGMSRLYDLQRVIVPVTDTE